MMEGKSVILPRPFDVLQCISDDKRKGKRVLASLNETFELSVYMAPPGVAILAPSEDNMFSGIVWMQCTNATKFEVGYICVGRYNNTQPRQKKFANMNAGHVDGCFLCIPPEFYFDSDSDLGVAYHMLDEDKLRGNTLSNLMTTFIDDGDNFISHTFTTNISTVKVKDITLVYLQQVLGPSHKQWNVNLPIYTDKDNNDITTIEMCDNPNSWTNRYINADDIAGLYKGNRGTPFVIEDAKFRDGQGMLHKLTKKSICQSNNPIVKIRVRLLERAKKKSDLFVCTPRPKLIGSIDNPYNLLSWWVPPSAPLEQYYNLPMTTNYSASFVLEFISSITSPVTLLAELHAGQYGYVKNVANDYSCQCTSSSCKKHLHKNKYNEMLNYLLDSVGRKPICVLRQTINDNVSDTARISLLSDDEPPTVNGTKLSSNINKLIINNTLKGDADGSPGTIVQHIFSSPYENPLTLEVAKVLRTACWGTSRDTTDIVGVYQNMGLRSTGQGSASMGAHPKTKHLHDYWSWKGNTSIMPLLMKVRNILRAQTSAILHSCGTIISPALRKAANCDICDIQMACLFTFDQFGNTRHVDERDVLSNDDSRMVVKFLRDLKHPDIDTYLQKLAMFHSLENLPVETACLWTLLETNEEYEMRNGFVNFTAGTMLDLSSRAFEFTEVIGSVFLGSIFEHCTTHPIWVRKSDGTVRFTPPPETPYNSPTAWGTHETTRKEKAAAARAIKEAIRARDKRAKKRAKHNSTR